MSASTVWWVLTGALVAAELGTGTFYLLMIGLGAAAGALAAHAGLTPTHQVIAAALVGGFSTWAWYRVRRSQAQNEPPPEANPDVNLDIGQTVEVSTWDAQGRTQVHYRGAQWTAQHTGADTPCPGTHRIVALRGSILELQRL